MTTLHDLGGELGRHLDTFFWALTISWSRLLARVRSGPKNLRRSHGIGCRSGHLLSANVEVAGVKWWAL